MLFAPGMRRLFSTHPSLEDRLKAIDPQLRCSGVRPRSSGADTRGRAGQGSGGAETNIRRTVAVGDQHTGRDGGCGSGCQSWHRSYAGGAGHSQIVARSRRGCRRSSEFGAGTVAGVGARYQSRGARAAAAIHRCARPTLETADGIAQLLSAVDALEPEQRMPALLRAIPALRQLTRDERMQMMSTLNGMLQREGRVSLAQLCAAQAGAGSPER